MHNLDLISTARQRFRPQTSDEEIKLVDQTEYKWDPEWSHLLFVKKLSDISSAATATVSLRKNYLRATALTIDATLLNHNTNFNEKNKS